MAKTIIAFFVLLYISSAVNAADIVVGGSSGWTTGFDYTNWASGQTFTTSDTLVFNFGPSHSVMEVNQSDYDGCNVNNPISSSRTSPTRIQLTATGNRYFICPQSNHCQSGMKLAVTVSSGATATPPPSGTPSAPSPPATPRTPSTPGTPATPRTPSTPTTPATPGTPTTTSSPPPPPNSAPAGILGSSLIVASFIAAVFGLMV